MRTIGLIAAAALISAPGAWASSKVLPTGTKLAIRATEPVDSASAAPGQRFTAVIERDVIDRAGVVLIPKGSPALLTIRRVSGEDGNERSELALQSVMVGNRHYYVDTIILSDPEALFKNGRSAETIGAGALLGGEDAMAGSGTGSAAGNSSPAAVGSTGRTLARGRELSIPAETVLKFRLTEPLQLRERR